MLNPDAMNAMGAGGASDMAQMMMAGDTAGVLASLQGAAREVGLERMWLFTQKNQFTRRMLETMGLRELERAIGRAERDGDEGLQAQLSALRSAMFGRAREYVERPSGFHDHAVHEGVAHHDSNSDRPSWSSNCRCSTGSIPWATLRG